MTKSAITKGIMISLLQSIFARKALFRSIGSGIHHKETEFGLTRYVITIEIRRSAAVGEEFLERGGTKSGCDGVAGS